MKKLRLMVKEPNKPVEEREFEISYKDADERSEKELALIQGLVGGYVEAVFIGGDVKVLINEEGLFQNLDDNCGFVGNIVFVKEIEEEDDFWWGSLTDDDVRKVKAWTINHASDIHPGSAAVQVLTGEAAEAYRRELHNYKKTQKQEWDSF